MKIVFSLILLLTTVIKADDLRSLSQMKLVNLSIEPTITSLLQFAASGDLKTVKLLISSGVGINNAEPNFGATALHNAAALGHLDMVKWLVMHEANINIEDKQGYTALNWAKEQKRNLVVEYLSQQQLSAVDKTLPTILEYPSYNFSNVISIPESSFHDWKQAETEAQSIISDWENSAISVPWTKLQLQRYIKHKIMPGRSARGLALTHVAMYDALIVAKDKNLDQHLAVSMAAAEVLAYIFPAEERAFMRTIYSLASLKYATKREKLPTKLLNSIKLGQIIANHVIQRAQNDGAQHGWNGTRLQWYGEGRYYGPGSWEPTPPYFYYPPEEPYAPTWKTWVLNNGSQFRSNPPPKYGSEKFIAALKEVLEISKNLTSKQLKSANFWVDGHGTVTPAGHWNLITIEYLQNSQFNDIKIARLFAQLNIAMADSYISAWDTKYHYWSIRPVTAAKKILDQKFSPAILTPPFPSYVSGHAATSGAASQILAHYFTKSTEILLALGDEAAMSRLYGGIHYRFDNDEGLILGRKVSKKVLSFFEEIDKQSNKKNDLDVEGKDNNAK